jgi:low affinity Fe/Cu permease
MPDPQRDRADPPTIRRGTRATRGGVVKSLEHPSDRREEPRGPFDRFSQRASHLASSPLFFVGCALLVLLWAAGYAAGAGDRFEAATAGLMSAVTLILVALLRNAELRAERALQTKLDAIASSLLEDRRGHHGNAEQQLEHSIGVHDEI